MCSNACVRGKTFQDYCCLMHFWLIGYKWREGKMELVCVMSCLRHAFEGRCEDTVNFFDLYIWRRAQKKVIMEVKD